MPGVRMVFRHFPLPPSLHKHALISAKAVEAGNFMGKGWEMVRVLFDKQEEWSVLSDPKVKFGEYAKSLGLDEKVFLEKLDSKEVVDNVALDAALAMKLNLAGTPTIYVNGEQVGAPFVVEKVKELLKAK
jgi:protein-disulfide isomerase